jgi:hypothetical protein
LGNSSGRWSFFSESVIFCYSFSFVFASIGLISVLALMLACVIRSLTTRL